MKAITRTWKRLAIGLGFVVLALCAMHLWNKHHFCQGWSEHYAALATEFRLKAEDPALQPDEARKYLIAADIHEAISRKYAAVASHPWRRYPGYPLITPEEQTMVDGRH